MRVTNRPETMQRASGIVPCARSAVHRRGPIAPYFAALLVLMLVGLLVGSVGSRAVPAPPELSVYYEDAVKRIDQGDYEGALVQLKNALQRDPKHLPARILLGKTYLRLGQGAAAEKELRLAWRLGADEQHIFIPLGNALLLQRKYQEILDTIRGSDPAAGGGVEVLTLRGRASYELGHFDDAEASFAMAAVVAPQEPDPLLGQALVMYSRGRWDDADALIARALVLAPKHAEAWYQSGELKRIQGDLDGALSALNRAIELNPGHMRARLSRATVYLDRGENTLARDDAEYVHGRVENDVKASFILWQALVRIGDTEGAKEAFRAAADVLSLVKEDFLMKEPGMLRIAALISLAKGDLEKANRYLTQFANLNPRDYGMRKVLGSIKLELGDSDAAIKVLHPLYRALPNDVDVLALLGDAYMRSGNFGEAMNVLQRAVEIEPDEAGLRTRLAMSQIGTGHTDAAITALDRTVNMRDGTTTAGILLTLIHVRRGEYAQAAETIVRLRAKEPENPLILNLSGVVHLNNGETEAARADFQGAIDRDVDFVPARYNLAQMELNAGRTAAAARIFQAIIARQPRSGPALIGLSEVALREGRRQDAIDWLEKAVALDADSVDAQVRLVEMYMDAGRKDYAMRAASRLADRFPGRSEAVETLASVQLAAGARDDALLNFRRAVRFAGFAGDRLMRIATNQVALKDYAGARNTLTKALQSSAAPEAGAALVRLDVLTGDLDAAHARAAEISAASPDDADGHVLLGHVHLARHRAAEALAEYQKALAQSPSTQATIGIYNARAALGQQAQALQALQEWVGAHPDDLTVTRTYAFGLITAGRLDDARRLHEELLTKVPDDAILLSNLARIFQLQKDPRAAQYAERAVRSSPELSVALDTYGWILVTGGDSTRGLPLLRDALSRDNNPLIRYHLAVALKELGRVDEARKELDTILNSGYELAWRKDVEELHARLSGN
ncbi:MAG: PEP-CTERM system TPR-repeat protein PrsT [Gammaproteobacteria bacterium]|nr:PEP-CTERM system TPR-repeat protein PrsT [Gammaproteobacteria bacterium]